jgi:Uma2 family endonuclease
MTPAVLTPTIPRLQNGDTLDSDEFMRRYDAMPELKKAELIEGVVYMPSPVRAPEHGYPHADLLGWLGYYRIRTPNVHVADNTTVRLDQRSVPQPDALMHIVRGGPSTVNQDGYIEGGPELVAEVAASSVSIDRNAKFRVYRDHGVREYVLWRVEDGEIDWFVLRDGQYVPFSPGEGGILRSEVFPGLWLDPAAMAGLDAVRVHEVLLQGIASPDHAAFVERMRQAIP